MHVQLVFLYFQECKKTLEAYFRAVFAINTAQDTLWVTKSHTNISETVPV